MRLKKNTVEVFVGDRQSLLQDDCRSTTSMIDSTDICFIIYCVIVFIEKQTVKPQKACWIDLYWERQNEICNYEFTWKMIDCNRTKDNCKNKIKVALLNKQTELFIPIITTAPFRYRARSWHISHFSMFSIFILCSVRTVITMKKS